MAPVSVIIQKCSIKANLDLGCDVVILLDEYAAEHNPGETDKYIPTRTIKSLVVSHLIIMVTCTMDLNYICSSRGNTIPVQVYTHEGGIEVIEGGMSDVSVLRTV